MAQPHRHRLPNRRPSHTEALEVVGQAFTATVGFELETGGPRELFLTAGKEGSMINAMLADAAVVISVALQHGISAQALAKSAGRPWTCCGHRKPGRRLTAMPPTHPAGGLRQRRFGFPLSGYRGAI